MVIVTMNELENAPEEARRVVRIFPDMNISRANSSYQHGLDPTKDCDILSLRWSRGEKLHGSLVMCSHPDQVRPLEGL